MKRIIIMILIFSFYIPVVLAESSASTTTESSNIRCYIDNLFIESYSINGYMYLPINKFADYGFNVDENDNNVIISRNKIVYFDGDYSDKIIDNGGMLAYTNQKPVLINGRQVNTYLVGNNIVIQADELMAFGKINWNEHSNTVNISIIVDELKNAYENAENKVSNTSSNVVMTGQQKNGIFNGIVKTSYYQDMIYIGYMIDGEYNGVVYGYCPHQPYIAQKEEIKTVKDGKKNGYCSYFVGYNNKPPYNNEIIKENGFYEHDKLKQGTIVRYIGVPFENYNTYAINNFEKHLIMSTCDIKDFKYSNVQVFYNGKKINFEPKPIIEKNRILIPLRALFESINANVSWDEESQKVIVTKDNLNLLFQINHYDVFINENIKYMDVPVRLIYDTTMIPLRFLSEELGYKVEWNESTVTINITK